MFTGCEILFKYKVVYHFIGVIFQMGQSAKIHFSMPCETRSFQTGNVKWQPRSLLFPSPNYLLFNLSSFPRFYIYLVVQFAHFHPLVVLLLHLETGDCDPEVPLSQISLKSLLLPAPKSRHTGTRIAWWCNDQMNTHCYLGMNSTSQKYFLWPGAFSWFSFSSDMSVEAANFQRCRELQTIRN